MEVDRPLKSIWLCRPHTEVTLGRKSAILKNAHKKVMHQNQDVYPSFSNSPVVLEHISAKKLNGPKNFCEGIGWVQDYYEIKYI